VRILLAEDDEGLRSVVERGLRESGYVVDVVADGDQAAAYLRTGDYSAVILDWRMPKKSGLDVLAEARSRRLGTPILMLTARDTTADRVAGLDAGADDYLVKPFDFAELLARIRALLRRPADTKEPRLTCGNVIFDPVSRSASVETRSVSLTTTELSILELLLRRSPGVVGRRSIALQVWDEEADAVGSNTIDVHIARLRAKLSGAQVRIETVRGVGYRMVAS
jgi:DNA-binding response OmpR family regulator